jgi:hypothetical protein
MVAGDLFVLKLGLEQAPGFSVAHDQEIGFLAVLGPAIMIIWRSII